MKPAYMNPSGLPEAYERSPQRPIDWRYGPESYGIENTPGMLEVARLDKEKAARQKELAPPPIKERSLWKGATVECGTVDLPSGSLCTLKDCPQPHGTRVEWSRALVWMDKRAHIETHEVNIYRLGNAVAKIRCDAKGFKLR